MKLTIIEDRETLDLDEKGDLVPFRRITYMLDDKGPYIYQVPSKEWSQEKFRESVKQKASELKSLEGEEF
ncbi:hypothetical protein DRO34_04330 [Candidatus Bathyarchaeota archaeon]|nr:MAG: hypothetical protein DRO34_04330 [Candidatus Bathyarchaeota archaeon]